MPLVDTLRIAVGSLHFVARLELERAPRTCAAFLKMLPFENRLIQARWSGESAWIPLGALETGVAAENATGTPAPGEILLYPAGVSETEILFPYGETRFASRHGALAGNHFLTIVQGRELLPELGRRVLHEGAQPVVFRALP